MNTKIYQSIGETVIFDCNIDSNPIANAYWFKNNSRITESKKYRLEVLENNFYRLFVHVSYLKYIVKNCIAYINHLPLIVEFDS